MSEPEPRREKKGPKSEFITKLEARWALGNFVSVGLDSYYPTIPSLLKRPQGRHGGIDESGMRDFNIAIIEATSDLVCAFKLNIAFYEEHLGEGFWALEETIKYIKQRYPDIPVILDAKRGDTENTNLRYVRAAFDRLKADAVTINPWLGKEALQPFLDREDKGIIVIVRTSNPGAGEIQDLPVGPSQEPLYKHVARRVANVWDIHGNVAVEVGATCSEELAEVRGVVGNIPILIPGVGNQGGEIEAAVKAGMNDQGEGIIVNSSREIIFASEGKDFAQAARKKTEMLRVEINKHR